MLCRYLLLCCVFYLSRLGLPTSSSQCITGGIIGVGLMEGFSKGVNWKMFGKQFMSWVSTLFVVGIVVAAIFAQVSTVHRGCVFAIQHC